MDIKQLDKKLKSIKVPLESYYLHGLEGSTDDNDKLSLKIIKEINGIRYIVCYKEKGIQNILQIFNDEDNACNYFFKKMKDEMDIKRKFGLK